MITRREHLYKISIGELVDFTKHNTNELLTNLQHKYNLVLPVLLENKRNIDELLKYRFLNSDKGGVDNE